MFAMTRLTQPQVDTPPRRAISPHFGYRRSHSFLGLLHPLVTNRPPEALQNLVSLRPSRIPFGHASYRVRTTATITPAVPTRFTTATSRVPTIHVLRFAESALVAKFRTTSSRIPSCTSRNSTRVSGTPLAFESAIQAFPRSGATTAPAEETSCRPGIARSPKRPPQPRHAGSRAIRQTHQHLPGNPSAGAFLAVPATHALLARLPLPSLPAPTIPSPGPPPSPSSRRLRPENSNQLALPN